MDKLQHNGRSHQGRLRTSDTQCQRAHQLPVLGQDWQLPLPVCSRYASASPRLRGSELNRCRVARVHETKSCVGDAKNLRASNPTPGNSFRVASFGSGQAFDQSERTKTTEPSGMRPCLFSQASMSVTWSA